MSTREEQIERAARASWELANTTDWDNEKFPSAKGLHRQQVEAAAVAAGWIPPKPAPTAGQRIAEGMIGCEGEWVTISNPVKVDHRVSFDVGRGSVMIADEARTMIAAAIDHALATQARPAVDFEKVVEQAVTVTDPYSITVYNGTDGRRLWVGEADVVESAEHLRAVIVALLKKASAAQ